MTRGRRVGSASVCALGLGLSGAVGAGPAFAGVNPLVAAVEVSPEGGGAACHTEPAGPGARLGVVSGAELQRLLHSGKDLVLFHLWASWCRPCLLEWPALADMARRVSRRGVDVVNVSVDGTDSLEAAEAVLAQLGTLPGRSLLVPLEEVSSVMQTLDPAWSGALPTSLLLDAQGNIVLAQRGGTDLIALEREIDRRRPRSGATSRTRRLDP